MTSVSMLIFILTLSFYEICSYEITSKNFNDLDQFPRQFYNAKHPSTIFRKYKNGRLEAIHCPSGYEVDPKEIICVKSTSEDGEIPGKIYQNVNGTEGTWPNPENCATYINCNRDVCYIMNCNSNLLYSAATRRCEWPLDANCCEYRAKNDDLLVQGPVSQSTTIV